MPSARSKNLIHFHFIVFLFGFTSILGALIQLDAIPLVAHRMLWATGFIGIYILVRNPKDFLVLRENFRYLLAGGVFIAFHWMSFFYAVKVAGVSLTLSMLSMGAFFTALLEPLFFDRKIIYYELIFGALAIIGLLLIFQSEWSQWWGMLMALLSTILGVFFTLVNGKLANRVPAAAVSFYELGFGALLTWCVVVFNPKFFGQALDLGSQDVILLGVLSLVCTAYAFVGSVHVMKILSPYSVMISINMEPIYGIVLSVIIFGEKELLGGLFYLGVVLILSAVLGNGYFKIRSDANQSH